MPYGDDVSSPKQRLGRNEWIRTGLEVLMEDGESGVAVEALARRLGVTKGSFYWHFENRKALLTALLEAWEREGTSQIIETVERDAEDPKIRLRKLVLTTVRVTEFDRLEGALRSWAMSSPEARRAVQRVDRRRLGYVVDLLVASGIDRKRARWRANLFYRALIGEFVYRSSGGKALEKGALEEIVDFMLLKS